MSDDPIKTKQSEIFGFFSFYAFPESPQNFISSSNSLTSTTAGTEENQEKFKAHFVNLRENRTRQKCIAMTAFHTE